MHVRELLKLYFRGDRSGGPLRLQVPGLKPVEGAVLTFVSNVDPWTYLGSRPVRTNPRTTIDGGLGVFALRSLGLPTVLRVGGSLLRRDGDPRGRQLVRYDDVPALTVRSSRPIGFQVDGDYLGHPHRGRIHFSSGRAFGYWSDRVRGAAGMRRRSPATLAARLHGPPF